MGVLTKRISSQKRDPSVTAEAVARAKRALTDRHTLIWVTGRQLRAWYLERALLDGYSSV